MKPQENNAEYVQLGTERFQIFSSMTMDGKPYFSLSSMGGMVQVSISIIGDDAIKQLKELRNGINGSIKYLNDMKGKINDEAQK